MLIIYCRVTSTQFLDWEAVLSFRRRVHMKEKKKQVLRILKIKCTLYCNFMNRGIKNKLTSLFHHIELKAFIFFWHKFQNLFCIASKFIGLFLVSVCTSLERGSALSFQSFSNFQRNSGCENTLRKHSNIFLTCTFEFCRAWMSVLLCEFPW